MLPNPDCDQPGSSRKACHARMNRTHLCSEFRYPGSCPTAAFLSIPHAMARSGCPMHRLGDHTQSLPIRRPKHLVGQSHPVRRIRPPKHRLSDPHPVRRTGRSPPTGESRISSNRVEIVMSVYPRGYGPIGRQTRTGHRARRCPGGSTLRPGAVRDHSERIMRAGRRAELRADLRSSSDKVKTVAARSVWALIWGPRSLASRI